MRPPAADGLAWLDFSPATGNEQHSDADSPLSSCSYRAVSRRLFSEDTPPELLKARHLTASPCSTPTTPSDARASVAVLSACPFYLADIPSLDTLSSARPGPQEGQPPPSPTASSHSDTSREAVVLRSQVDRAPGLVRSRSLGYSLQESANYGNEVIGQPQEPVSSQADSIRMSLLRSNTMPPIQSLEVVGGGISGGGGHHGFIRLPALRALMKLFAALLVVAVTVATMIFGKEPMNDLLQWLEAHNTPRGMAIFVAIEAACVSLLIPAVPLIIGAGLVFGFAKGLFVVWAGGAIGQMGAFLLARYILRDCMVHVMQKRFQGWDALDKAIQIDGWKLIMLLRVSPLVPYNVLNVMLGSSGITFKTFAFFSTIGIVPECMITVYFGTLAGNIANVINGNAGPEGPMKLVMIVSGGVMMLLAALYAGYVTKKAIRRAVARAEVVQDIESMQPLSPLADASRVLGDDEFEPSESSATPASLESAHQRRADTAHQAQPSSKQSHGGSSASSSSGPRTQTALRSSIFGGMPGMPMVSPVIVSSQEAEKRL